MDKCDNMTGCRYVNYKMDAKQCELFAYIPVDYVQDCLPDCIHFQVSAKEVLEKNNYAVWCCSVVRWA